MTTEVDTFIKLSLDEEQWDTFTTFRDVFNYTDEEAMTIALTMSGFFASEKVKRFYEQTTPENVTHLIVEDFRGNWLGEHWTREELISHSTEMYLRKTYYE